MKKLSIFRYLILAGGVLLVIVSLVPWFTVHEHTDPAIRDIIVNHYNLTLKKITVSVFGVSCILLFLNYLQYPFKRYPLFAVIIALAGLYIGWTAWVHQSYRALGLENAPGYYLIFVAVLLLFLGGLPLTYYYWKKNR